MGKRLTTIATRTGDDDEQLDLGLRIQTTHVRIGQHPDRGLGTSQGSLRVRHQGQGVRQPGNASGRSQLCQRFGPFPGAVGADADGLANCSDPAGQCARCPCELEGSTRVSLDGFTRADQVGRDLVGTSLGQLPELGPNGRFEIAWIGVGHGWQIPQCLVGDPLLALAPEAIQSFAAAAVAPTSDRSATPVVRTPIVTAGTAGVPGRRITGPVTRSARGPACIAGGTAPCWGTIR